ncbi:MAG: hypothetical protein QOJ80_2782 [Mycobacterium sp.]|nr:hypothetical protein [Mycobacterium sp.]
MVYVDEEADYRIASVAPDFASFIRGLVDPKQYDISASRSRTRSTRLTAIDRECGCGGGPLTAHASIVRSMNLTLAHLLAGVIADAADQLSGTPPESRTSVADRALSGCGDSGSGDS